jgi:hypothetical protein
MSCALAAKASMELRSTHRCGDSHSLSLAEANIRPAGADDAAAADSTVAVRLGIVLRGPPPAAVASVLYSRVHV